MTMGRIFSALLDRYGSDYYYSLQFKMYCFEKNVNLIVIFFSGHSITMQNSIWRRNAAMGFVQEDQEIILLLWWAQSESKSVKEEQ